MLTPKEEQAVRRAYARAHGRSVKEQRRFDRAEFGEDAYLGLCGWLQDAAAKRGFTSYAEEGFESWLRVAFVPGY